MRRAFLPLACAVLFASALGVACGDSFEPPSRVDNLRLLAVRVDKPFARPGDEVLLEALAVDPAGRTLTWGWATCVNPRSIDVAGCLAALDPASLEVGVGRDRHLVRIPADTIARLPERARAGAVVGVAVIVCPGSIRPSADGAVPLSSVDASGTALALDAFEIGVKRVFVRDRDENANPTIDAVTWDGEAWAPDDVKEARACDVASDAFDDCPPSRSHRIEVRSSLPERGEDELRVPFDEQQIVQMYATEGIFEHPVRIAAEPTTRWVPRKRTGEVSFWFVVRDDRGGVTWAVRRARVL
jgi:hypothetical protein